MEQLLKILYDIYYLTFDYQLLIASTPHYPFHHQKGQNMQRLVDKIYKEFSMSEGIEVNALDGNGGQPSQ